MYVGPLHRTEALASVNSVTSLELIMAAVIIVLAVLLWAVRTKRTRDQRRRKATSSGYYNLDAARFGVATRSGPTGDTTNHATGSPALAPSFVAPGHRQSGRTTVKNLATSPPARPAPIPSFAAFDLADAESEPLPPFDPAVPAYRGPVRAGSAPPPPPPLPPSPSPPSSSPPSVSPPPNTPLSPSAAPLMPEQPA